MASGYAGLMLSYHPQPAIASPVYLRVSHSCAVPYFSVLPGHDFPGPLTDLLETEYGVQSLPVMVGEDPDLHM